MKSISEFVWILLILIVAVVSISVLWLFYHSYFTQITLSEETSALGEVLSSCMKIDSVKSNKIYLKNCGSGLIKNDTLNIFIDEESFEFTMTSKSIRKGDIAEITIKDLWGINIGNHKIKIASPSGKVERYVKSTLPDSCVLNLEFEEGEGTIAYDSSVYGNDGTLLPVGSEPSWVDGKFGKALEFDGVNDLVNVSNSASLELTDQFTVSAWFKPARDMINFYTSGYYGGIGKKAGSEVDYGIFWCDGAKGWKVEFYNTTNGRNDMDIGASPAYANNWYHIVGTYNGTHLKLYVNGTEENTRRRYGTIRKSGEPFEVGHYKTAPKPFWNGTIDSVRVYNKALTPDETLVLTLGELT